jgi:aminoglycoside phosphotransferase (APT) family kinase protein
LIHGDLKPEHVIVGRDGITFIDLDSAGRGRALSDLATLSVRMGSAELAADLVDRYRRLSPEIDWSHWETELTMANVKLALFHAQHREENWEQRVLEVLAAGDDRAPGRVARSTPPGPRLSRSTRTSGTRRGH